MRYRTPPFPFKFTSDIHSLNTTPSASILLFDDAFISIALLKKFNPLFIRIALPLSSFPIFEIKHCSNLTTLDFSPI
ncbi:MAG: hypothetical protein EZS28_006960 [Streblomastix strix]|uniref:Uncharacterized protein n=1 Tax=Streblomastix strix TaxID=222440 RepID=A0A5J4WTQ4_9EUKA|nr:MAG: hypothetical protein EZS28_006960 [Streblomastix strix]